MSNTDDQARFLRRRWGSTQPPEGTTEPRCNGRCVTNGQPGTRGILAHKDCPVHRPSPPAPAAEDEAVVSAVQEALAVGFPDLPESKVAEAATAATRAALDAAGVSALRQRYRAVSQMWDEAIRRAKAAEAEVERLTLLADDRDHDRRQARLREAEARQQVDGLRAGIEALAAEFEKPCPSTLAYRSEVVRAVRALAGSGEQPGEWRPCRCESHEEGCTKDRPAPVVPDSTDVRGLHNKYRVERWDGRDRIGEKHDGCRYFVLDLTHDEHAAAAVRAYAEAAKDARPTLSADLLAVVGQGVTAAPEREVLNDEDDLATVLATSGLEAEPVVVREGFRVWTLTEDENGQWWAWSWREEGEDGKPVRAETLRFPLTVLHRIAARSGEQPGEVTRVEIRGRGHGKTQAMAERVADAVEARGLPAEVLPIPAPVVPDSTGLRERAINAVQDAVDGCIDYETERKIADAVLAVVGQDVTTGCCDPSKVETRIEGTWLVDVHPHHTCGAGESGHYGAHEPGCGLVPVVDLRRLPGWDDLRAVVRSGEQGGDRG